MSLLHDLEHKHFNRLTNDKVIKKALENRNYAYSWFTHLFRSDASIKEVILSTSIVIKWGLLGEKSLSQLAKSFTLNEEITKKLESSLSFELENLPDVEPAKLYSLAKDVLSITCSNLSIKRLNEIVWTTRSVLPDFLYENVLNQVRPQLQDVSLFGEQSAETFDKSIRNNSQFLTPLPNASLELAVLERIIANSMSIPIAYAEPPVILRYLPGQYYHWHYDHIYPHTEEIQKQINQFGQRISTGILNLNDNFIGGETEFKASNLSIKAAKGQVISFNNSSKNLQRIPESIHRGKEVIEGEKWIMTLWFRDKPYWVRNSLLD